MAKTNDLNEDVTGTIAVTEILATVPYGADGVSATVGGTAQESEVTANNFANIVMAEDAAMEDSTVTLFRNEMAQIPCGTFNMGHSCVAEPIHEVTLTSDYLLGKYQVTNAQVVDVFNWANAHGKFTTVNENTMTITDSEGEKELLNLNDAKCHIEYSDGTFSLKTGLGDDGYGGSVDLSNYPCIVISWYGAAAFCNYLSEMEGLNPCFDLSDWSCNFTNNGYRLPTEAEWEYASRYIDGSSFRAGNSYSGSNIADDVACFWDNSYNTPNSYLYGSGVLHFGTHEVGTKAANELGIYDMSGNVWEWCYDWHGHFGCGSETDPIGPSSGAYRITRGGSWDSYASLLRTSNCGGSDPSHFSSYIGFRLVRTC